MELPKRYEVKEVESKWKEYWERRNIYKFDPENTKKPVYSIDTPPPTVSGKMHMGHAFGNSQQDFIARFKRMNGFNVLQPFGTDDNGLPTQTLIQKLKKVRAQDLSRKEFTKLCLNTLKNELRPRYTQDWKDLGISCDFNVFYTTISEHSMRISQNSFIELYEMGRAYRKEAPAIWCPKCQTAIAQVELEDINVASSFNDIVFKSEGKDLIIATTRPELLPACVAVFFHPGDKRYKKLSGKMAKVPLFDFEVPILPDPKADPEKGTGIVMCCTFGDKTDVEWQKEHNLPIKSAINRDGTMSSIAGKYEGMKIKEARTEIIKELNAKKLLKSQEQISHDVNCHERCGTEIEFVHSKQWFVRYLDLKKDMIKWGKELKWYPPHMKNRYDNWVKGLSWDWCISRQIYFGIPFPVWYCKDCDEMILARTKDLPIDPTVDKPPISNCPNCKGKNFKPETDIINTWATSSLTPTLVKELFKGKPVYNYLIKNPMDLRPQGHDIISFWLFNTVVKSHLHYQMRPWNDCFINGWMLDAKGKKMAKSKGNVIEPQVMIEKYSADALRFMAAGCKLGDDLPFPEKDIITGQKTLTKLWNASKFSIMHLEDYKPVSVTFEKLEFIDKWLLIKLNKLIKDSVNSFNAYEYSKVKSDVNNFFWSEFCDNYLEISKDRLYNPEVRGVNERKSAQYALYESIYAILKMFAPFMPFITEEIYSLYFKKLEKKKSIHLTNWPKYRKYNVKSFESIEKAGAVFIDILSKVRKYKSDKAVSLKTELNALVITAPVDIIKNLKLAVGDIKSTTKAKTVEFIKSKNDKISVKIS